MQLQLVNDNGVIEVVTSMAAAMVAAQKHHDQLANMLAAQKPMDPCQLLVTANKHPDQVANFVTGQKLQHNAAASTTEVPLEVSHKPVFFCLIFFRLRKSESHDEARKDFKKP